MNTSTPPWKTCERCKTIPSHVFIDFLDSERGSNPGKLFELPGLSDTDTASGAKTWTVTCDLCGTQYTAETDVEPMVWDLTVTRVIPKEHSRLTKAAFAKQFDFEGLQYAKAVRIDYTDGTSAFVRVRNYWPTSEIYTDFLEGELMNEDGSPVMNGAQYQLIDALVPHPEIQHIEILQRNPTPMRDSHPQIGIAAESIEQLYNPK